MTNQQILTLKNQAFDKQRAVIREKSKRIALHVGRRGAKTSTIVLLYLMYALMHKRIRLLFFGVSGDSAEQAFLPHAIKYLENAHLYEDRDFTFNKTERIFTFTETQSTICLKGMDTSYKEMAKILGSNCFSACIDEMQDQTQEIEKAILANIQPAVSDWLPKGGGSIFLLGTSGDYQGTNFWYRLCNDDNHLGWTYYTWLDKENPHMLQAKLMEDQMYAEQYGPDFQELDWYQQQYLNRWLTTKKRLVYQFSDFNFLGHPDCKVPVPPFDFFNPQTGAVYGLGMDFGFSPDPMAFGVVCYNTRYSNQMHIIYEHKQNEMYVPQIAEHIRMLDAKYHFSFMVADAGAQAKAQVSDLNNNYGFSIQPADKLGKVAHINTFNGDLRAANIIVHPQCQQLKEEWSNLIFDQIKLNTQNKREEKEGLPNDLSDAILYAFHYCRHQWYQAPKPKTQLTQEQFNYNLAKELLQRDKPKPLIAGGYLSPAFANVNFQQAGHRPGRNK